MLQRLYAAFWRFVFFWKRLTGFVDLKQTITVTGRVIQVGPNDIDGDLNFDVDLDPGQAKWITGFGGRLTSAAADGTPSMHCEIPPWASGALRALGESLRAGDRVAVTGAWGFDGVHTGRAEWLEVLLAILRHGPNVREGWLEIHPVVFLEIL